MKVSVLGETYEILLRSDQEDPKLKECDGYCDWTTKTIVIDRMDKPDVMDVGNVDTYMRKVIRHEIVHAFALESGLDVCSEWAKNEEMVDWIAMQAHKLHAAFKEAGAIA